LLWLGLRHSEQEKLDKLFKSVYNVNMKKRIQITLEDNIVDKIRELRKEYKKHGVTLNVSEIIESYLVFVIPYLDLLLERASKDKSKAFDIYWSLNKEILGRLFKNSG